MVSDKLGLMNTDDKASVLIQTVTVLIQTLTNNGLKLRLDMKDNRKFITISLPTSTWSQCFVGFEAYSGSVYDTHENLRCDLKWFFCEFNSDYVTAYDPNTILVTDSR